MEVSQVLWSNICDICEVFALCQHLHQLLLVYNLWAGSVDKYCVLWHLAQQSIIDGILGLSCGWAMQRNKLGIEQLLYLCAISSPSSLNLLLAKVWIICREFHTKSLSDAVQVTRNC